MLFTKAIFSTKFYKTVELTVARVWLPLTKDFRGLWMEKKERKRERVERENLISYIVN